jgi:hypothetical protein
LWRRRRRGVFRVRSGGGDRGGAFTRVAGGTLKRIGFFCFPIKPLKTH